MERIAEKEPPIKRAMTSRSQKVAKNSWKILNFALDETRVIVYGLRRLNF